MSTTLVLAVPLAARLRGLAMDEVETGGVILARLVRTPSGNIRLLARELIEVPDHAYERRGAQELLIRSDGYVPALALAEHGGCVPIWFHTHPGNGSSPAPSGHDLAVNQSLSDLFRLRADSPFYGALIVGVEDGAVTFTGSLDDGCNVTSIDRLWVVGPRLALYQAADIGKDDVPDLYDRNVRAFGGPVQQVLGNLRVAVVG